MDDTNATLAPGAPIGDRYEVVRPIGQGGMGTVYEASDRSNGGRFAVKVLDTRYCLIPEVVKRFEREARLAAAVGHENICTVVDHGLLDGRTPFLVMPLLEGQPLSLLLRDHPASLTRGARLTTIVTQALSALGAAHDARVIHRDLKPENIFITRTAAGEDQVKLLDFGVSKMVRSGTGSLYTKEGTVIGTPAYMAPEQARGSKSFDHRIDIYAMGVILYEIMTGTRPHRGETSKEILFKIIAEPFLSPRRINPDIPAAMERLILKAMAKDPHARFASAEEMTQAFVRAAGDQAIPAMRETSAPTLAGASGHDFSEVPAATDRSDTPAPGALKDRLLVGLGIGILLIVVMTVILWVFFASQPEAPLVVPLSGPGEGE